MPSKTKKDTSHITIRLKIRPLRPADYGIWKKSNLSVLPKQTPFDEHPLTSREMTRRSFLRLMKDQRGMRKKNILHFFGVFSRDTKDLIGYIMFFGILRDPYDSATLGCRIFNRHWRQGYGKEALSAGLAMGFDLLQLHRIECPVDPKNSPSIAMCTSCGMKNEGLSRKRMNVDGKWEDMLVFTAIAEEWKKKWGKKDSLKRSRKIHASNS